MSEKEPDYSFFDNFESCYKIECEKDEMNYIAPDANYCEGAQFKYNNGNQVVDICKDMVKLFNNAIFKNVIILNPLTENKVPEFINYWINKHLTKAGMNDNVKEQFCQILDSITNNFDERQLLKGKIYHIKEKEVDGMNILYELYKNIHEFEQKKTEHFKNFLENFMTNYNKGLIKCFYEGNVKFCHELNKYREFYEGNKKKELSEICDNKECPSLTELTLLASASKKEHLNIAEIGSKLIKGSDISSLNGLSFLETEDYSKLKDLISLQYNLRMEKDEDEKNSVMLEILYQYLKYCNKHNNIWYLEEFINEFINKYYNKEEKYYEKLFTNCKSEQTQTKVYCTYYKQCKSEFNKDFTLIENDIGNYKESIKEHFKKLTPDISLIQKALDLFKDFDSILRNSPTIMSTLIAVFLCLFFLYKLTPISSIFRKEKKKRKIPLFYPQRIIQDVNIDNSGYNKPKAKGGKIRFAYQPS